MRKLLLALLLPLGAGAAHAGNGLLYVGAGLTNDNLRDVVATNSNLDSTSWKICGQAACLPSRPAPLEYENFRIPSTNGANVVSLDVYLNIF